MLCSAGSTPRCCGRPTTEGTRPSRTYRASSRAWNGWTISPTRRSAARSSRSSLRCCGDCGSTTRERTRRPSPPHNDDLPQASPSSSTASRLTSCALTTLTRRCGCFRPMTALGCGHASSRISPRRADGTGAHGVTERLLAEGGAVSRAAHPARAAVEATLCAALLHEQRELAIGALWRDVAAQAEAHPDPSQRALFLHRAVLGQIAAQCTQATRPCRLRPRTSPPPCNLRTPAHTICLRPSNSRWLDARLSTLSSTGSTPAGRRCGQIQSWSPGNARALLQAGVCDELASFACMLTARVLAEHRHPGTEESLRVTLERLPVLPPRRGSPRCGPG